MSGRFMRALLAGLLLGCGSCGATADRAQSQRTGESESTPAESREEGTGEEGEDSTVPTRTDAPHGEPTREQPLNEVVDVRRDLGLLSSGQVAGLPEQRILPDWERFRWIRGDRERGCGHSGEALVCWARDERQSRVVSPMEAISGAHDIVDASGDLLAGCALRADGSISCWDRADDAAPPGLVGWDAPSPLAAPLRVTSVAVDGAVAIDGHCARRRDGTVTCWQSGGARPFVVRGVRGVVDLSSAIGADAACAIDGAARVSCWGRSLPAESSAGARDAPYRTSATRVPGVEDAVSLSIWDSARGCAVRRDGRVVCWSLASHHPCAAHEIADVDGAVRVAVRFDGACALRNDGTVRCWGWECGG